MSTTNMEDIQSNSDKINFNRFKGLLTLEGFDENMVDIFKEDLDMSDFRFYIDDFNGSTSSKDDMIINHEQKYSTRFNECFMPLNRSYRICIKTGIKSCFISLAFNNPLYIDGYKSLYDICKYDLLFHKMFYLFRNGGTPLLNKLNIVLQNLKELDQSTCMKRKLIIYTDSKPTDSQSCDIILILNEIAKFNCSITIRLCTGDNNIRSYWDTLDREIKNQTFDVIDNYRNEKKSVKRLNQNLKYKYPIHTLREFGMVQNKFNRMSKNKLTDVDIDSINALYDIDVGRCC